MRINGAALTAIRERSGMKIARLSEASGVDRTTISNIEAGRRNASPEVAVALASALKVELPALLADPAEVTS